MIASMRGSLRLAGAITLATIMSIGAFVSAANASPNSVGSTSAHEYCAAVLANPGPHQTAPRVTSKTCSSRHAMGSSYAPRGFAPAATHTPLITFYQYTNYKGASYTFYGGYGNCDASGYGLKDGRVADYGQTWGPSSWQAHSNCWHTKLCYGYAYGAPCYTYPVGVWEAGVIGSGLDNHVWSFWVGSR